MNLRSNIYEQIFLPGMLLLLSLQAFGQQKIRVGAKHFNEGYILSEIISQLLEHEGYAVERKYNLGGTTIAFEALRNNNIDVYPEYTGTISGEILKHSQPLSIAELKQQTFAQFGLQISESFGFNNTYALVMNAGEATQLKISTVSDLVNHSALSGGLSPEFISRKDGWHNLVSYYGLKNSVKGIEHGIAYQALLNNSINFTDAYSTDGEIVRNKLAVLADDKHFFPEYKAVAFYRTGLPEKAIAAINKLGNQITENEMQQMNAAALYNKKDFSAIAATFLFDKHLVSKQTIESGSNQADLFFHILEHLWLTFISIFISVCVAVPLGIFLYKRNLFIKPVLFVSSILQTIPSIALLALFIPLLGIGKLPAIVTLCLYALLPILRNTITGLQNIDPQLKFVAKAIGLNDKQSLQKIELPLALPTIITGIRVAAVINIGTATLAAFIGAGGLGEYIVTGLALNNTALILKGAIPSALLAILVELLFDWIEKRKVKHLTA